ncbi:MAG: polyprenyl synthetase family protein [Chloroflexota bacterium]
MINQVAIPSNIENDLTQVDAIIAQRLDARPLVSSIVSLYMGKAHNVHLRAALVLLSAQQGEYDLETVVHPAAAVELIHQAFSIHNSLIGDQQLDSAHTDDTHWNGSAALMTGDYLLALASAEMALVPDSRIIRLLSQSVMAICEGMMSPDIDVLAEEAAISEYLSLISNKTASLFASACKAGIICGHGRADQIETLGRLGYHLGTAFHIIDDVHDILPDNNANSSIGNRLRQGLVTLPLIYAVRSTQNATLAAIAQTPLHDEARVHWTINAIHHAQAGQRALVDARLYLQQAQEYLADLPDNDASQMLGEVLQSVAVSIDLLNHRLMDP